MLTKIQCEGMRKLIWDFIFNLGFYSQREAEQFKSILFIAFSINCNDICLSKILMQNQ